MLIAVVDGMGGGLGAQIISQLIHCKISKSNIIALGTNAMATSNMLKPGGIRGATGENAVKVSIRNADIIVGPIGIVMPNSLMGEITPAIAEAVMGAQARKILVPVTQNHVEIMGLDNQPLAVLIKEAIGKVCEQLEGEQE